MQGKKNLIFCPLSMTKTLKINGKIIKYDSQLDFKCKSKLKLESNAKIT